DSHTDLSLVAPTKSRRPLDLQLSASAGSGMLATTSAMTARPRRNAGLRMATHITIPDRKYAKLTTTTRAHTDVLDHWSLARPTTGSNHSALMDAMLSASRNAPRYRHAAGCICCVCD